MVIPWKLANEIGDPSHSVFLLLGVAALLNSALVIGQRAKRGEPMIRFRRTEIAVAGLLAIFTLLGNLASALAIQQLSPAVLNVLMRADVLFVAFLGGLVLREHVERRFWFGAAVAVVGLVVLQRPAHDAAAQGLVDFGSGMAIAAAASFSCLAILTRRFIHEIDPVSVNAVRLWLAVALWFLFNGLPNFSEIPPQQVFYAAAAAFAGPFLGRLALMISARYLEARVTTLATLTTPAITLVLGFLILSDWPETHELIGGAIMIAGIAIPLVRIGRRRA